MRGLQGEGQLQFAHTNQKGLAQPEDFQQTQAKGRWTVPKLSEANIGVQGVDQAVVIKVPEVHMLLQHSPAGHQNPCISNRQR